MTKSDRLAFLKARHQEIFGARVVQLLPVSKPEEREEKERVVKKIDDSIVDEELAGFKTRIEEPRVAVHVESEDEILLSKRERIELEKDMFEYRLRFALVLWQPNAFQF